MYEEQPQSYLGVPAPTGFERRYSEDTAQKIDAVVRKLVDSAFSTAVAVLRDRRKTLDSAAALLQEKETFNEDELRSVAEKPA